MALTLRLEDDELATLERVKQLLGAATASAAIKQLIATYETTQERLASMRSAFRVRDSEAEALKAQMLNYFEAQEALARMVGHVPNQKTIDAINTPDSEMASYATFDDFLKDLGNEDD